MPRTRLRLLAGLLLFPLAGCGLSHKLDHSAPPAAIPGTALQATLERPPAPPPAEVERDPLRHRNDLPPERRALLMVGAAERIVDAEAARAAGYTLVDLSDGWTPFLFQTLRDAQGQERPNRYRRIFVGLANDRLDDDGQPLEAGEKNYLELYGIPPSLSVLRARFLADAERGCEMDIDWELLHQARPLRSEKNADRALVAQVERRLACEGLPGKRARQDRHRAGAYDDALHDVVRVFQQKHMIYESPYYLKKTLLVLGRRQVENDYETLKRVLTERVVSAAGILEDGSAQKTGQATYRSAAGQALPVPNLVEEYSGAFVAQLGLGSPEAALGFFRRHPEADFGWLRAAVKLPERPEYHAAHMDLSVVVDRGDVWYDLPFDDKGKPVPQPREVYPSFTLYAQYLGQRFPLARWRTTVGGWRSEQAADGYEYYRYKGSDIGPRVIRRVSSGPVWIAPETTPLRTLVKERRVNRRFQRVVNYDEIGPGYRSAYGLVAGYFVTPGQNGKPDWDNGIRAHGSAEYLSINSSEGYSHGCHRLLNHLAVRLYSFVLTHRAVQVHGDQPMSFDRSFLWKDQVYTLRIPTKGFDFELTPPLPVNVLEGRIRGERKQPYVDYVPKPGVQYPGPPPKPGKGPEDRAGGGSPEPEAEKEAP